MNSLILNNHIHVSTSHNKNYPSQMYSTFQRKYVEHDFYGPKFIFEHFYKKKLKFFDFWPQKILEFAILECQKFTNFCTLMSQEKQLRGLAY